MSVVDVVGEVEAAGVALRLCGDKVRVGFPDVQRRHELAEQVAFLRAHREEVTGFLRERATVPEMPPGIRLLAWNLKEPPIAIESCAVVVNPTLFAKTSLVQLGNALANPACWFGWSVPQLIDRLSQVGVVVAFESIPPAPQAAIQQSEGNSPGE
jgi:hypothetical protein